MEKNNHYIEYWPNGNKKIEGYYETQLFENHKTGVWTSWYENGQIETEVCHEDGCRDGPSTSWHENGQKESELNYENGWLDGGVTIWHDNGQKGLEGFFRGGEKSLDWRTWYRNGQQQYEGHFYSLLTHDSYCFDPAGEPIWQRIKGHQYTQDYWMSESLEFYDDNWRGEHVDFWWDDWESGKEGTWTEWYKNGQKKSETIYKDYDEYQTDVFQYFLPSEKYGLATEWYKNGQKKLEGCYFENLRVDEWNEWYASGEIKSTTNYTHPADYEEYPDLYDQEYKDGKSTIWYKNGYIKSEKYYNKGKLYASEKYKEYDKLI